MQEKPKNLQQIAQEKFQPAQPAAPVVEQPVMPDKLASLPPNHIQRLIDALQQKQHRDTVWFNFTLPSNGKCGYPSEIQLREMTTLDEKILIKEMFSSKENSVLNVIKKCARFETLPDFDFENLTVFDQDYILVELSAITFPGEKDITITDDANHKVKMKLNKEDLTLVEVPADLEYPFALDVPQANIKWYLNFMTLKKQKDIDRAVKSLSADVLTRLMVSIAISTEKVEMQGTALAFDNFYEIVKVLEALSPADLKTIIDFYNDKTGTAYGYKLEKEYYCAECGKGGSVSIEPLSWFRITL